MYLTKKVYFGCGIITLMPSQEKILMQISESILLQKIGLSKKFLRKMLHARKSVLGGLLKLSTILAILSLKLYLEHVRAEDRFSRMILINKENATFQNRHN